MVASPNKLYFARNAQTSILQVCQMSVIIVYNVMHGLLSDAN